MISNFSEKHMKNLKKTYLTKTNKKKFEGKNSKYWKMCDDLKLVAKECLISEKTTNTSPPFNDSLLCPLGKLLLKYKIIELLNFKKFLNYWCTKIEPYWQGGDSLSDFIVQIVVELKNDGCKRYILASKKFKKYTKNYTKKFIKTMPKKIQEKAIKLIFLKYSIK